MSTLRAVMTIEQRLGHAVVLKLACGHPRVWALPPETGTEALMGREMLCMECPDGGDGKEAA